MFKIVYNISEVVNKLDFMATIIDQHYNLTTFEESVGVKIASYVESKPVKIGSFVYIIISLHISPYRKIVQGSVSL